MPLEDFKTLKEKNKQRLLYLINVTYSLGINITAPSKFKDNLRIISVYLLVTSIFTLYGHVQAMIRNFGNISLMSESICLFFQILISFLKLSYMAVFQRRFFVLLNKVETHELVNGFELLSMETPYNKELRKDAIKILNASWKFGKIQFYFYMWACVMIFSYYFVVNMGTNIYNHAVGTANYTNVVPFSTLYPFWEDKLNQYPHFPILVLLTLSGASIAPSVALSFDGIFIYLALHGAALIQILKKAIPLTTSAKVPKVLRLDYLLQCIRQYEITYRYCTEVNGLYLHLTLAQFLLSLIILGVVMFQGTVGLETDYIVFIRMVLYISAAGYEVVIYCLNGQAIISESDGISNAWYECNWYNESIEFKQLIRMIIMRSNRTIIMRASWFSTMSLTTLLNIMRTSGSYFLLLRNLAS
uniref:Odorant receptor n=1 Tax=Scaeva pyrastri TaxID=219539 RepID=A0A1B3B790_SCAPY|nr:putative odorant receptor OR10 [Scaeva pyrastri]